MRHVLLVLAAVASLAGARAARADDKAVKRFKEMVAAYPSAVAATEPRVSPPEGLTTEWYRRKISVVVARFDVKKSDSLLTPIVGEFHFDCVVSGTDGPTKESVTGTPDTWSSPQPCRAEYGFDGARWTLKTITCLGSTGWYVPEPENMTTYWCAQLLPTDEGPKTRRANERSPQNPTKGGK
jgi:hypothetical protein